MVGMNLISGQHFLQKVVAFRLTFIGVVDDRLANYPLSSQGIAR